jgi:MFS family permease
MTSPVIARRFTLGLLTSLYLAQGLPFGFFTQALPVLMRERGLSLTMIGFSSVLFLPWALKFLWAPWVDGTGTRRRWILTLQLLTFAGAAALAFVDLGHALWLVFGALVFFNLLAATQDIAADGLAVRLLGPADRGLGNGIQVGAYRFGMILGGGALLWIFANAGWSAMFLSMAAILLLTCLPVLFLHESPAASVTPREPARALMTGWVERLKQPGMLGFVALICAYKFGESATSSVVGPFMHDAGIGTDVIAIVKGAIGSVMGLLGAAVGGALAFRIGRRQALILCGIAQTLGMLGYVACALQPSSHLLIYVASALEHGLGSMATVALFTLMMDASDADHAGTDYTLLACAIVIGTGVAGIAIGLVGDWLGYVAAFLIAAVLSGSGCLLLIRGVDRGIGPPRLSAVWPHVAG